jgi:hypothetical protein
MDVDGVDNEETDGQWIRQWTERKIAMAIYWINTCIYRPC